MWCQVHRGGRRLQPAPERNTDPRRASSEPGRSCGRYQGWVRSKGFDHATLDAMGNALAAKRPHECASPRRRSDRLVLPTQWTCEICTVPTPYCCTRRASPAAPRQAHHSESRSAACVDRRMPGGDRTDASDTLSAHWLITCCLMSIEFVDLSQLVAKRLLQRAKQIDIREDDRIRVARHLTLREFSQLAGADGDAVYATLRDFIDRGWIRVDDDSVIIADSSSARHHLATAPTADAHPLTPVGRYAIHIAPPFGIACTVRMRLTSADGQTAWRATIYTAVVTPRTPRSMSNGTTSRILDNG